MSRNPFAPVLHALTRMLDPAGQSADALLLERFALAGDESAFAALVERHAPMVWGVCRRVARDGHAAEDAFQATWLVLSRKAGSLKDGGTLPGWLHRVACRLALAARPGSTFPLEDALAATPGPEDEAALRETRAAIDEEVERLPEKYRLPVLLCFYEGRTHAEAAAELGWPVGTVAGRVARAKDLLHARLTRRGLAPSVWPLPLAGAFPPVAGKAAGGAALALAAALLAGETKRRWLVGAAILLLSCVGAIAGFLAFGDTGGKDLSPPRSDLLSPIPWIPRNRIAPVEGDGFAVSPDGLHVVAWRDGAVRLFHARTNREVETLPGDGLGAPDTVLFSPDGKLLAASGGKKIRVWDWATRRRLVSLEGHPPLATQRLALQPKQPSALVGFSPDSSILISAQDKDDGGKVVDGVVDGMPALRRETHLWNARSGEHLARLPGGDPVMSPDGKLLATCDLVAKIPVTWLWEVSSGKKFWEFRNVVLPVFHPDSQTVAAVGYDAIIRLYDCKTGKERVTFDPNVILSKHPLDKELVERSHQSHAFSRIVAVGGDPFEEQVRWSNYGAMMFRGAMGKEGVVYGPSRLSFSPDGETLTSSYSSNRAADREAQRGNQRPETEGEYRGSKGHGEAHLWDVPRKRFLAKREEDPTSLDSRFDVSRSRDGKTIFIRSGSVISRWDERTGRKQGTLDGDSVAYSPDGKRIITGSTVWDAEKGTELFSLKGDTNDVTRVAFSPDGRRILTGSRDGTVKVWEAEKGTEVFSLKGHTSVVRSVAYSPDGKRILTGSSDSTAKVWDAEKGKEVLSLEGHTGEVSSVAFSPDGKRILTGGYDWTARVWDAEKGTEVLALKGHTFFVSSVAFSPDGKRILTGSGARGSGEAKVWDAEKGQELLSVKDHTGGVTSVAFSPDGKRIATGHTVRDAKSGKVLFTFAVHSPGRKYPADDREQISGVAFSPDGKTLALAYGSGPVYLWDVSQPE